MPFDANAVLPQDLWEVITRLGEAQLMLPTGLALVAWLAWCGERRSAALWLSLLGFAVALTTATKIVFIGWGIGIASLNFTGISGHAMHAAAVFPLLLRCVAAPGGQPVQRAAVAAGYLVAALVAASRVAVHAHSPSEVVAGLALGGAVSAVAIGFGTVPHRQLPHWLLGVLVAAQLLNPAAAPTLPTHDMVTQVALSMSGHDKPYTRSMMLRQERRRLKALQTAAVRAPTAARAAHGRGSAHSAYKASAVVFFTSSITA